MSILEQRKLETPFHADEGYFNEFFRRVQSRVGLVPEDLQEKSLSSHAVQEKKVKLQYTAQLKVEFGQARTAEEPAAPVYSEPTKPKGKENIDKIEIAPLEVQPNPTPAWRNFAAEWSAEEIANQEVLKAEQAQGFDEIDSAIEAPAPVEADHGMLEPAGADPETRVESEPILAETAAKPTMTVLPNEGELARLQAELERQEQYSRVESPAPSLEPAFAPITGSNRSQIIMNSLGAVASLVAIFAAYFIWQGIQRPITIDEYVDTSLASRGIGPVASPIAQTSSAEVPVSAALVSTILEEESLVEVSKPSNVISIEGLSSKGQKAAKALESYDLCVFDDPNPFFEETIF